MMFKQLFCDHEYKTILWYRTPQNQWANYLIETYSTRVCMHCGKIKNQKTGKSKTIFRDIFEYKIRTMESQGYVAERECLDELQRILKAERFRS